MRTESIRVAHVLEATVGGTKRHLCDLALGLYPRRFRQRFQQRFRQHVFLSRERDPASADEMIARLQAGGIEVTVIPMTRGLSLAADWRALRMLEAALRAWQPDIIHGHSSKAGFLARAVKSPAKRVYTPHGFAFQMRGGGFRNALYLALERWAGRRTDALIALCESEKRLAVERGIVVEERVRVIENGVAVPHVAPDVRPPADVPHGRPLVGTVGALTEQKETLTLVVAMAYIRRCFPDSQLVVVGEGHLRSMIEGEVQRLEIADAVRLLGQRNDVPAILAALDVFVLPSLWEGLPYALLEAMAAGVPCVGSAIPGITDLITDGETGLLASGPRPVAEGVMRLLSEPELARRCADGALARVRTRNTISHMVAQTAALYEELYEV